MKYFTPSPKKGSESKSKLISRRAFVLTSFKFVFLATIISRLFYMQVVKKDEYTIRSDKNRFRSWKLTPSRGVILDKHDHVIADNFQVYKIALIPKEIKSIKSLIKKDNFLSVIYNYTGYPMVREMRDLINRKDFFGKRKLDGPA